MSKNQSGEYWGKNPDETTPAGASGGDGYWKGEEAKHLNKRDAAARETAAGGPVKKKRRWGRILVVGVLLLLLALGALIGLAPTIASSVAPGLIASKGGEYIDGSVSVESTSFGWGGPQTIKGLKVIDKEKKQVASVKSIEVSAGLLGLIMGNLDVGTVTVTGATADVVKGQDGKTNLEKLTPPAAPGAKPAPAKSDGGGLPDSLKAKIVIKNFNASFTDETSKGADGKPMAVALNNFDASAQVGAGQALKLEAKGDAGEPGQVTAASKTGSISITATIDRWTDKTGKITLDKATADVKADVKNLPLGLLDAFVGSKLDGGSLRKGLGDLADLSVVANGDMSAGSASISLTAPNATVKGKLKLANNTITSEGPVQITMRGAAVPGLSPSFQQSLTDQKAAKIETLPDLALTLDQINIRIPNDNSAIDFRGSGAMVTIALTQTLGTVVLGEGQPAKPFRIAPLSATIDAKDLSKPVRIGAATTADIAGQPAGALTVDITAGGLLDAKGAIAGGVPADLTGTVALKGVATAIAQPFVQAMKINLPNDVGPTLDAEVKIATDAKSGGANPPADIDLNVQSEYLKINGGIRYAKDRITTRGDGLRIDAARVSDIAARRLPADSGFVLWRAKPDVKGATVVIKGLDVPMLASGQPDMKKMTGDVNIDLEGFALVPIINGKPESSKALVASTMNIKTLVTAGGNVKANIVGKMWNEVGFFDLIGNLDALGLLTNDKDGAPGIAMDTMKPTGTLELKNVPVTVARLAAGKPGPDGQPPLDLVELLRGVAGPKFSITADAKGADGGAYDITAAVRSDRVTADLSARGSPKQIDLKALVAAATVSPETVSGLMKTFAPTVTGVPQLAAPSQLSLTVDPISIPIGTDGKPDFTRVGLASMKMMLPGKTLVRGLTATNPDGTVRDLGQFGVQDFELTASAPVAAVMGAALPNQRAAAAKFKGSILGNNGQSIGLLDGDLGTEVNDKQLAGPLTAKINITQIDVEALERIMGKDGAISGAIGSPASARLDATVSPPAGSAKGEAFDFAKATTTVSAVLEAPKFRSDGPLSASLSPDAIRLTKPSKFTLDATPAWINSFLKTRVAPGETAAQAKADLEVKEISPISLTLGSLSVPRAGPDGKSTVPLQAAINLSIPRLSAVAADGTPMRITDTSIDVKSETPGANGTPVAFSARIGESAVGDKPPVAGLSIRGVVDGLVDSGGAISTKDAMISTQGDFPNVSTALLDALSVRNGSLVDGLGPTTQAKFNIERFPLDGVPKPDTAPPVIDFAAKSERASASLRGTVRDNMYVSEVPLKATVTEVTTAMSARFIKSLPLLGSFQKTAADAPATLNVSNITAPLNDDMSKLNADIAFDPGEAKFGTSGVFGDLLKVVNARQAGTVGKRLEPLNVQIRSGVATYQRWKVPVGEFSLITEGTVDLVQKQLDVITYIPFGALTDKAVGSLNLGVGSALSGILPGAISALTEVPFRTKGPMDNPTTKLDPEMFAKNLGRSLNPGNIIKDDIGGLLKKLIPKENPPK